MVNPHITQDTEWGDPNNIDTHMVVVRCIDTTGDLGRLIVDPGAILTTNGRRLGLIILCDTALIQGTVSMTARGANHSGTGISNGRTDATDIMLTGGTTVKGLGGLGGEGFIATPLEDRGGNNGLSALDSTGGGGTGSFSNRTAANPESEVKKGAQGTIFAGGASSGGVSSWNYIKVVGGDAGENGGQGGSGNAINAAQSLYAGDGIGNPSGGLAGFLAIYARTSITVDTIGKISSRGSDAVLKDFASGGGTGGGLIFLATRSLTQNGTIDVSGGKGALSPPVGAESGDGGNGTYIYEALS